MVEVRRATIEDVDWLLMQLRAFEKFAGYKRSLIEDEAFARAGIASLINEHVVFIAHKDGERHGFVAGAFAPHPFNPKVRVLSEMFWWIVPEHRDGRAAVLLLDKFEECGRGIADWVVFSLEHNSPVRDKHLTSRGFRQIERAYLLEV